MLSINFIEKIIGYQEVIIKNIEEANENLYIHMMMKRKECVCPVCKRKTNRVHDYRKQMVRELNAFGKKVWIILQKRRYVCSCGKRFIEPVPFLPRYQRMTQRCTIEMINRLADVRSYTAVAKEFEVSVSTVIRRFEYINYPKPDKLPEMIGIDEFKGNSGGQKYHCILTDLKTGRVIDIIRTRYEHDLIDYFKKYDRSGVSVFVSDMYSTYSEIAETYFPKAIYVTDRYHWIRQAIWAFEAVRKEVQKKFSKSHRIYFKHSRKLLLKRECKLSTEEHRQVNIMLYASAELSTAYFLKEELYRVLDEVENPDKQKAAFEKWISDAECSGLSAFERCAKTYNKWKIPILNSLRCPYTNGFTEGCNNKIKVLKRNAYGLKNFKRFRNRILFLFSSQRCRA